MLWTQHFDRSCLCLCLWPNCVVMWECEFDELCALRHTAGSTATYNCQPRYDTWRTACHNTHTLLHDTSSTRLVIFEQIMLYYHLLTCFRLILHCYVICWMTISNFSENTVDGQLFLRPLRVHYREAVTTASGVWPTHTNDIINLGMAKFPGNERSVILRHTVNHRKHNQKGILMLSPSFIAHYSSLESTRAYNSNLWNDTVYLHSTWHERLANAGYHSTVFLISFNR